MHSCCTASNLGQPYNRQQNCLVGADIAYSPKQVVIVPVEPQEQLAMHASFVHVNLVLILYYDAYQVCCAQPLEVHD